jgi:hypothetical protein
MSIQYYPTGEMRLFSPDERYVPFVLQREWYLKDDDGKGYLWLDFDKTPLDLIKSKGE